MLGWHQPGDRLAVPGKDDFLTMFRQVEKFTKTLTCFTNIDCFHRVPLLPIVYTCSVHNGNRGINNLRKAGSESERSNRVFSGRKTAIKADFVADYRNIVVTIQGVGEVRPGELRQPRPLRPSAIFTILWVA